MAERRIHIAKAAGSIPAVSIGLNCNGASIAGVTGSNPVLPIFRSNGASIAKVVGSIPTAPTNKPNGVSYEDCWLGPRGVH